MTSRRARILLFILVVAHVALTFRYHTPVDTAHRNFRYAQNLASGHGLVWNPGERVDGYTSLLWTLLLAPLVRLGVDALTAATVLATLSTAALIPLTYLLARRLGCGDGTATGAATVAALSPYPAFAAGTGLETAAFTALAAGATVVTLRTLDGDGRAGLTGLTGILLGLLTLVRPEGALLAALVVMALVIATALDPERRRHALEAAAGFAIVVLPAAAWHTIYYGSLLPMAPQRRVELSLRHLGEGLAYVNDAGSLAGAAALILVPFALVGATADHDRRKLGTVLALTLAWIGYVIAIGGEAMPMFRLLVPALPLIAALAACGFEAALPRGPARAAAGLIAITIAVLPSIDPSPSMSWLKYADKRLEHERLKQIGQVLDRELPRGSSLATGIAGTVGYYANELTIINTFGVTDRHIAASEPDRSERAYYGFERGDGDYVHGRAPDYVMPCAMLTITPQQFASGPVEQAGALFRFKTERELWAAPGFQDQYEMISLDAPGGGYVNLFRRKR